MIKNIKDYDSRYTIDDIGNVYSNGIKLVQQENSVGYLRVRLCKNGKRQHKLVHRLVYETFIGPIPENYEINHKDHNKYNNSINNLEVVTHSENLHKAFLKYGYFGNLNMASSEGHHSGS